MYSQLGSWPATLSRPSLGASTVVSILIVVVLPAPLGPRKPKTMPASTANEMWSTAVKPVLARRASAAPDGRGLQRTRSQKPTIVSRRGQLLVRPLLVAVYGPG